MSYTKETRTQEPNFSEPTRTMNDKDIAFVSTRTDEVQDDNEPCGESIDDICVPLKCDKIIFKDDSARLQIHNSKHNTLFNTDNLDIVEHPNHYGAGKDGLQCIEAMLQTFGKQATMDFCKLNSFKYIWRSDHKEKETQDMEKAKRYLEYWHVLNNLSGDSDDGSFHDYLNS